LRRLLDHHFDVLTGGGTFKGWVLLGDPQVIVDAVLRRNEDSSWVMPELILARATCYKSLSLPSTSGSYL
jgi:hypothetical protein